MADAHDSDSLTDSTDLVSSDVPSDDDMDTTDSESDNPDDAPADTDHDLNLSDDETEDVETVKTLEPYRLALRPRFPNEPSWLAHRRVLLELLFHVQEHRRRGLFVSPANVDIFIICKMVSMWSGDASRYATYVGEHPTYEQVFQQCVSASGFESDLPLLFVEYKLLQEHFHEFQRDLVVAQSARLPGLLWALKRQLRPWRKIEKFVRENVIFGGDDPQQYLHSTEAAAMAANTSEPTINVAANTSKPTINRHIAAELPIELLMHILHFIPNEDAQPVARSVLLVNKAWSAVGAKLLYQHPSLPSNLSAFKFFVDLQINSHFAHFRMPRGRWRDLGSHALSITMPGHFSLFCGQFFPSLRRLSLRDVKNVETLQPLIYHPPRHLRELKLHITMVRVFSDRARWDIPKVDAFFSQLTKIHWCLHDRGTQIAINMPDVLNLSVQCGHSNLAAIAFSGFVGIQDQWLALFFSRCSAKLSAVDLGEMFVTRGLLDAISQSCPNIHALRINCRYTPKDEVERFLKHQGSKLEFLDICTSGLGDHNSFWNQVTEHCTSLRYLICDILSTVADFVHFRRFIEASGPRLEGLACMFGIHEDYHDDPDSFQRDISRPIIAKCGTRLRYLSLSFSDFGVNDHGLEPSVTAEQRAGSLKAVVEACSTLRAIHVDVDCLSYLQQDDICLGARGLIVGTVEASRETWEDKVWSSFFERH
ncbi:hypothetical protein HK102_014038 [Quaeritorhiza haematococci]|nr:hypothetical protein HK102_014038 [Quaeritorhiza haematococci]